jgi:thioredoxin 1
MNRIIISLAIALLPIFSACGNSEKPTEKSASNENEIKIIDDMSSFNEIINSNTPVLVDFYADWCAPCRMMAPILEQVSKEMNGKVRVVKVNVDKNSDAAHKYQIRSIPTMILFRNGKVQWQGVGVMQADQIKSIIEQKI